MGDADEVHGALDVLELTTVHYRPGDPFSVIFAYTTLTPLIILVALVTLLLFRRDLRTGLIFSGLLVNEVFNYILKRIIKEARPPTLTLRKNDYGMPSSHAQFLFFFSTYICFALLTNKFVFHHKWRKLTYTIFSFFIAVAVAYSRIYLGYHTEFQVLVGSIVGILSGAAWWIFTEIYIRPMIPYLESLPISRYFYVRDTAEIGNVMRFEYENVMAWKKAHGKVEKNKKICSKMQSSSSY